MPTPFESAIINLKLFDLRREPVLRDARRWFLAEFNPESFTALAAIAGGARNASPSTAPLVTRDAASVRRTNTEGHMHPLPRPDRRDWIAGLAAGASLGLLFLGIGARVGMRVIALSSGQPPIFSIEGSIAVSLLGALTGALIATVFMLARTTLPTRRWIRGALFWVVCAALALRGLRPVTALNAGVFLPLFLVHGVLLHAFWCRVYLARMR